jgi:hypothetical protein
VRQTCSGNDPGLTLSPNALALSPTVVAIIPIDGGGRWLIDADGRVYAEGSADHVTRIAGIACAPAEPVADFTIRPLFEEPVIEPVSAALPIDRSRTVEPRQLHSTIVQVAHLLSDLAGTSSSVATVYETTEESAAIPV